MSALDVMFLITQELSINGTGILEVREYTHLSLHFVQKLNTILLGLVGVVITTTTTTVIIIVVLGVTVIISSHFVLSS